MKRKRFAVIAVLSLMMLMTSVSYAETIPEREADVSSVSEGYMLAGFDGTYYHTSKDQILERINAIRKEAYDEGLVSKYVPIKWSSDLEYIAQMRAAEAAVVQGHTRPNGKSCFTVKHNNQQSWAEDLAWNYTGLMDGIEQWYEEKEDYVNHKEGAVTGHYTSIIKPSYKYIGIACFKLDSGGWMATAGELSGENNLDESESSLSGHYRQRIQVQTSAITELEIKGVERMEAGDTEAFQCLAAGSYKNAYGNLRTLKSNETTKVDWSSSNPSVATIDSDGNVTAKSLGTTTIQAVLKDGAGKTVKTATQELKVAKPQAITAKLSTTAYTYTGGVKTPTVICSGATQGKDYTVTLPAGRKAVGKYTITVKGTSDKYTGSKTLTYVINPKGTGIKKPAAAKKAFTAKWSKQSAKMNKARITGYQVQYSLKSNFKSAKTVTLKGYAKTSKKIGKLKAKKIYYVRVRTYMKSGKNTFYSTWSGRKSVKTK